MALIDPGTSKPSGSTNYTDTTSTININPFTGKLELDNTSVIKQIVTNVDKNKGEIKNLSDRIKTLEDALKNLPQFGIKPIPNDKINSLT